MKTTRQNNKTTRKTRRKEIRQNRTNQLRLVMIVHVFAHPGRGGEHSHEQGPPGPIANYQKSTKKGVVRKGRERSSARRY